MHILRKSWILIIAGTTLFVFSDLFRFVYAVESTVALWMGYLFFLTGFLGILKCSFSKKAKIFWTVFVLIEIAILIVIVPLLYEYSHIVYIQVNCQELNNLNEILNDKKGEISIDHKTNEVTALSLSQQEIENVLMLMNKIDCYTIWKNDNENTIYYVLDEYKRPLRGIAYSCDGEIPKMMDRHLKDSWYY